MAADNNFKKPANRMIFSGQVTIREDLIIEDATSMYPGRLTKYGTTVKNQKINDGISPIAGWLGYDNVNDIYKKDSVDDQYAQYDHVEVINGPGLGIVGALAANFAVEKGDHLIPWSAGTVVPAIKLPGGAFGLKIPFSQHATQYDTGIDLIEGMLYGGALPGARVDAGVASGTLTVGLGNGTESGYDADGILKALSCATVGRKIASLTAAATGGMTLGALLGTEIKDANASAIYAMIQKAAVCDGTLKSIDYTTSAHAISGYFYIPVASEGTIDVGIAKQALSASASIQDILVESLI